MKPIPFSPIILELALVVLPTEQMAFTLSIEKPTFVVLNTSAPSELWVAVGSVFVNLKERRFPIFIGVVFCILNQLENKMNILLNIVPPQVE